VYFHDTIFAYTNALTAISKGIKENTPIFSFLHFFVAGAAVAGVFGEAVFWFVGHVIILSRIVILVCAFGIRRFAGHGIRMFHWLFQGF
jgi:hypothetical protein